MLEGIAEVAAKGVVANGPVPSADYLAEIRVLGDVADGRIEVRQEEPLRAEDITLHGTLKGKEGLLLASSLQAPQEIFDALGIAWGQASVMVNGEQEDDPNRALKAGDKVDIFPPIAGGMEFEDKGEAGSSVQRIFSDTGYSQQIKEDLIAGNASILSQLLLEDLLAGRLQINLQDYGVAIAWLIRNFPLKKGTSEEKVFLVDEKPYGFMVSVLVLFEVVSRNGITDITDAQKRYFLRVLLSVLQARYFNNSYEEILNAKAIELVKNMPNSSVTDIMGYLETMLYRVASLYEIQQIEEIGDTVLLGSETIQLAQEQGWYQSDRSFVRHHLIYCMQCVGNVAALFQWALEDAMKASQAAGNESGAVAKTADGGDSSFIDLLKGQFSDKKQLRILDVGIMTGEFLERLKGILQDDGSFDAELVGVDRVLYKNEIKRLKTQGIKSKQIAIEDAESFCQIDLKRTA